MNQNTQIYGSPHATSAAVGERNKTLRNTYWLLALSMVPTVLGAWVGIATGFASALSPGIGLILFLGGAFGFIFAIEKNEELGGGRARAAGVHLFHGPDAVAPGR